MQTVTQDVIVYWPECVKVLSVSSLCELSADICDPPEQICGNVCQAIHAVCLVLYILVDDYALWIEGCCAVHSGLAFTQ